MSHPLPSPLDRAIALIGSQAKLAALLGVKQPCISAWKHRRGGRVPAAHCPAIERATDGAVRCEELSPSTDWSAVRQRGATREAG